MTSDHLTSLADIVLKLGTVDRITRDANGLAESVTSHTVMLALACREMLDLCEDEDCGCRKLKPGGVISLSLVHDLPEFLHGDVQTLRIDEAGRGQKERQEAAGREELERRLGSCWTRQVLGVYEQQWTAAARFVRAMDKNMPKLTHILNGCAVLREMKMTREEFRRRILVEQSAEMTAYAGEFLCVMSLHRELGERIAAMLPETYESI